MWQKIIEPSEEAVVEEILVAVITFVLTNFTATFAVAGFVIAGVIVAVRGRRGHEAWQTLLSWFLLIGIGVTYIFNGIMHTLFGDLSASLIGWENNGFQAEVGFASIGMGIVGVMAFPRRAPLSLKLAAIVGPACFLWGAAGTHIADIIATGNMHSHNAGVVLYTDLLIPALGFALWAVVWRTRPHDGVRRTSAIADTAASGPAADAARA